MAGHKSDDQDDKKPLGVDENKHLSDEELDKILKEIGESETCDFC